MIIEKSKTGKNMFADIVLQMDNIDYVKGEKIYKNVPLKSVMVSSSSDLSILTDYEPGTIAYTAGYQAIWQKGVDDTWESVV